MCIRITIAPLDTEPFPFQPSELARKSKLLVDGGGHDPMSLCPPGDCPCGFADGDPAGSSWTVREDLKEPLIAALQFAADCMGRFRLGVTWIHDPTPAAHPVNLKTMIELVKCGVIARRSYVVKRR